MASKLFHQPVEGGADSLGMRPEDEVPAILDPIELDLATMQP